MFGCFGKGFLKLFFCEGGGSGKGYPAKEHAKIGCGVLGKVQYISAGFRNASGNGCDESALIGAQDGQGVGLLCHGIYNSLNGFFGQRAAGIRRNWCRGAKKKDRPKGGGTTGLL